MDDVEDDADAALTWKALQDEAEDSAGDAPHGETCLSAAAAAEAQHAVVSAVEDALESADDDFVRLAELAPFHDVVGADAVPVALADDSAVTSVDVVGDPTLMPALPVASSSPSPSPYKRRNVSKHLQFLCLERYAAHVRVHEKLPERSACELLLNESFAQFVREGGSGHHPRLEYPEFLKLVRNRSRERLERLAKASACGGNKRGDVVPISHDCGELRVNPPEQERGTVDSKRRTKARKRKWADELAKIDELIEVIDRARRPATRAAKALGRRSHKGTTRDLSCRHSPGQDNEKLTATTEREGSPYSTTSAPAAATANELVDSILSLQRETRSLQRVIQQRLTSLDDQYRPHEPASASV